MKAKQTQAKAQVAVSRRTKWIAGAGVAAYAVGGTVLGVAGLVAAAKATSVAVVVGSAVAMTAGAAAVVYAVARGEGAGTLLGA